MVVLPVGFELVAAAPAAARAAEVKIGEMSFASPNREAAFLLGTMPQFRPMEVKAINWELEEDNTDAIILMQVDPFTGDCYTWIKYIDDAPDPPLKFNCGTFRNPYEPGPRNVDIAPPANSRTVPELQGLMARMVQKGFALMGVWRLHPAGAQDQHMDAHRPELPDGTPVINSIAYGSAR